MQSEPDALPKDEAASARARTRDRHFPPDVSKAFTMTEMHDQLKSNVSMKPANATHAKCERAT